MAQKMADDVRERERLCILRMAVTDMATLKVRIRGSHRLAPPELFYQVMPQDGSLPLATLPRGNFAVSLPQRPSWHGGWPFLPACPTTAGAPVVIYRLQENCRYEAVAVKENGRDLPLAEYVAHAASLVRERYGELAPLPGQYVYAAPDKDEWGGILSDEGYVAINTAAALRREPFSDASLTGRHGHVIQTRAPLYGAIARSATMPLPVFARVEVRPDGAGRWLSFTEYIKERCTRALIPAAIADSFVDWLERLTEESGFDAWRFRPGMIFAERTEWWGSRGRRRTIHEGVDFVEGFHGEQVEPIPPGTPVRALAAGEIATVLDDFMGKTIVMRHPDLCNAEGEMFHTLLSHIQTAEPLPASVTSGALLGHVGKRPDVRIRPHLHLTGAWYPAGFSFTAAGIDTIMHPGFTPALLADLNRLLIASPLCRLQADDRAFLAND